MNETVPMSITSRVHRDLRRLWFALAARKPYSYIMKKPWFTQLVRFGIVGVLNTVVYYVVFLPLLGLGVHYMPNHVISWFVSFVFSFFVNCRFTYRVKPTLMRFFRFPLGAVVNLAFTSLGNVVLVEILHVPVAWAPLISGIAAIPLVYLATTLALKGLRRQPRPTTSAKNDGGV